MTFLKLSLLKLSLFSKFFKLSLFSRWLRTKSYLRWHLHYLRGWCTKGHGRYRCLERASNIEHTGNHQSYRNTMSKHWGTIRYHGSGAQHVYCISSCCHFLGLPLFSTFFFTLHVYYPEHLHIWPGPWDETTENNGKYYWLEAVFWSSELHSANRASFHNEISLWKKS